MINMTFSTANIKESFYIIVLWHIHQYLHLCQNICQMLGHTCQKDNQYLPDNYIL